MQFIGRKMHGVALRSIAAVGIAAVLFTGCDRRKTESATPPEVTPGDSADASAFSSPTPGPVPRTTPESTPAPTPTPVPTPTPEPTPTPVPYIPRKNVDVTQFYNGITLESEIELVPSEHTASMERRRLDSYVLEMNLRIRMPVAARTLEELRANDPSLPRILPSLGMLLETGTVSPAFDKLYENKVNFIRPRLGRLEEIVSRHNFYDCDTILELKHPESSRRALLISADMDVNVDGSDGDRNVQIEPRSPFFQPQTSYRWPKQTERPNQFLAATESRLAEVEAELAQPGLAAEKKRSLETSRTTLRNRLAELRRWSFLISDTDPSIVLPGFMFREMDGPYKPAFGDYGAVIYNGVVYPAIVGDAGPSYKMGEASMRICREIEPRTSAARRAVSNIRVHYIVFPGTADADRQPPDLARWHELVAGFWSELGGEPATVFEWENLVPPWPTPTPSPTPAPDPQAESDVTSTPPANPASAQNSPATNQ